jgi:hypothetical protein
MTSLVSHWMYVDLFTVDQAAALWAEFDPARVSLADSLKPSEVVAAKQMLSAGIASGELRANSATNALSIIGDYSKSLLSRDDLEAFARKRGLFPAFLCDTLAPMTSTGSFLESREPARTTVVQGELPTPTAPINRGGRPNEHDWNTFILEIIRRANQPDGLPEIQAELVRDMLAWFQSTYGREPAESSVKERVSKIYKHLAEAENLGA